jgi:8-oxo-dGTP diphosphatase
MYKKQLGYNRIVETRLITKVIAFLPRGIEIMNSFNKHEFKEICNKFNENAFDEDITLQYTNSSYFNKLKSSVNRNRRGEVVFCVVRPNGKIVTITCEEYPDNIFRIPTGGVGHKEDIVEAVFREVKEELGLDVRINNFLGVLKIKFEHKLESVMFYSYIFILDEIGGRLLIDASDDEISEVKEVELDELEKITDRLRNIEGKWCDWGRFRFITTNAVLQYLKSR